MSPTLTGIALMVWAILVRMAGVAPTTATLFVGLGLILVGIIFGGRPMFSK